MKALVIEDNDRLRKSLLDYLRDEGFAADAAADGEEGFYKATNWDYDVIVLDVMIPLADGFEVLRKLRAKGRTTPVLMLTARGGLTDRLRGLNTGADDYLVKPFEMEELVARVRSVIRRSKHAPNPLLEVGPLKLDTANRTACLDGQPMELTAREYALLEMLVVHRDEVLSRDFLHEKLFDERDDSLSNMLDVYIYKLRQKVGKDLIRTRRGMGYQLVVESGAENPEAE
jgi:two-component system OmpR family response regulator